MAAVAEAPANSYFSTDDTWPLDVHGGRSAAGIHHDERDAAAPADVLAEVN
jgi:hypothetical protein